VVVAEQRLQDLTDRGITSGARYVDAQQRLESSRRQLHVATRDVTRAEEEQANTQRRVVQQMDEGGRSAGLLGSQLREVAAGGAALAGGALLGFLTTMPARFAEGARSAGQLATLTNSSVEEAGALLGVVGSLGLELGDLIEIQAEFAQKVAGGREELEGIGASIVENADGTTNWVGTIESVLSALQGVDDATERNRLGFAYFGEEGYKQLSTLVASGLSLEDALARVGTPFTDDDVAAAAEYDALMTQLGLSAGELERALGRALIPALLTLVEGGSQVVGVVTALPAPIALTTAAAIAMGVTGINPLAAGTARLSAATVIATDALLRFRAVSTLAGVGAATAGAAAAGASAAAAGMGRGLALLGGPLGLALIAGGVAFQQASRGADDLEGNARTAALSLADMEGSADAVAIATRRTANQLEEDAGYWERSAAYVRGYQEDLTGTERVVAGVLAPFQRLTMGFGDTADTAQGFQLAIADAQAELGAFGAQQELSAQKAKTLNDLIAEGTTGGREFGTATQAAAEAAIEQERTTGLAAAAIAAYRAQTDQAVQATLEFITARYASENANFAFERAMDTARDATDDATTSVDEYREAQVGVITAALGAASASADAAVESAEAAGQVVGTAEEASIRAGSMLADLREKLGAPGLTDTARAELQGIVDKLQEARDRGDIEAVLRLTGAQETKGELDETTEDRDTTVTLESRGGPAVIAYLDRVAAPRDTTIRVESRNGPAVLGYLDSLAQRDRLALIHTESRGGPAVDGYLGSLARNRQALIYVESRGGPAVDAYLDQIAGRRTAVIDVQRVGGGGGGPRPAAGMYGAAPVSIGQLIVQPQTDSGGRLSAQALQVTGQQVVGAIREYERRNGTSWRRA
jgi:hypothetical protein